MHIIISHHIISYGTTSGRVPNRANPSVQSRNRSVCAKSRAPTVEIGYAFSRKDLSSPRDRHNPPELRQGQESGLAPPPPFLSFSRGGLIHCLIHCFSLLYFTLLYFTVLFTLLYFTLLYFTPLCHIIWNHLRAGTQPSQSVRSIPKSFRLC